MTHIVTQTPLLLLLLLLTILPFSSSKLFDSDISAVKLSKKHSLYLTKFKFYPGGKYNLTMQLADVPPGVEKNTTFRLSLGVLGHSEYAAWEKKEMSCLERMGVAKSNKEIVLQPGVAATIQETINHNGKLPTYRYFVIFDCNQDSKMFINRSMRKAAKIKYSFDFRNENSHFEAGDEGLIHAYTIAALIFLAVFCYQAKSFFQEMGKTSTDDINSAYIMVNVALILKILSLLLDIVDLYALGQKGVGYIFLNFMSQACNHTSQYLLTVLLIFLARGWTIHFYSTDQFELFLPICILIGIFKVVIIGLGKMEDNSAMFFHRYDSFIGWILVVFNMGLFVYFVVSLAESAQKSRGNKKHFNFYINLAIFGSLYFFVFPFLMLVTIWIEPESRTVTVEFGRILSQLIALLLMAYVTSSKRGLYKQVVNFGNELPSRLE
jgi:hypothetical protein